MNEEPGVVIIPYRFGLVEIYVNESYCGAINRHSIEDIKRLMRALQIPCTVRAVEDGDQGEANLVPAVKEPQYHHPGEGES